MPIRPVLAAVKKRPENPSPCAIFPPGYMGATVSFPSITVDETAETITLTSRRHYPYRFGLENRVAKSNQGEENGLAPTMHTN